MSLKDRLNPKNKQRKVHNTPRVYFHATLKEVKVVDEYNNVLAHAKQVSMTINRKKGRSRIGKHSVINSPGHQGVYYRYINNKQEVSKWVAAVRRYNNS